jgi:PAS domain S-box-containing protein
MKKERKNPTPKSTEILIAEDSLTQALQIKHLLESHHYKVSVSQNGKQAMDWLSKHKPSLVISDIVMPEMNGYELCKKIKSNKNTEDIPVILLTVLSDPEEIIEGLSCGADSFITKPYNEKYLLSHIEKILSEENAAEHTKVPFGVQILFKGKKRFIQAEQQNVIKLMLNVYEGAIQQNGKLVQTREELRLLNERLESIVEDRTLDLSEEIKLSKQIANRLTESEERFRTLYNDAVVGLYRTNPQGEILLANLALVKMLGFQSFEELAAINLNRTGVGTTYQRQLFIDKIEKEGEIKDLEAIWICRDGKEIFVQENAKAIYDSEGKILYYDGTVQDITEQKKAAEALNEIQHLFETLAMVSPVGIFRTDQDGYTTYVNPKYSELIGLSVKEAMGRGWLNAVHPDDKEKLKESWLTDFKSRKISSSEYRFLRSDGSIVWVIGKAVPELIGNEVAGYIGTITDITERKQAEKALQESEEKFRSIMENSADAIFICDQQGKYLYTNKAVTVMLGYTSEEMMSKTIIDLSPKNKIEENVKAFKQLLREGKVFTEIELLKKDGNFISTDLNSVLLPGGLVYGSCRDITERKLAEETIRILARFPSENPDPILRVDRNGKLLYANEASYKLLTWNLQIGEKTSSDLQKIIAEALKRGIGKIIDTEHNQRIISFSIVPVVEEDYANLYGQDITERKQAEMELRKLSRAVEQSPSSIVITDTDGNIEYVNPKFCEITDYSKDELFGKNPRILSSGEMSKEEYKVLWNTITSGKEWKGEFHNKKKYGELYWENVSISPIKNDKGEITHYLGIKEDITEKKIMEAAVVANEQRYRELFLNNPAPTYIFDTESFEFIEVNDAVVQSYGYSREEYASMTLKDIRPAEEIANLLISLKEVGNNAFHSTSMHHRRKDGTVFPVEITSHSLPEKNGRKTRLALVIDITERVKAAEQMKLAKEKAEASDKLKTTFLNNISHEVRTPLNGILGFAEIMSRPDLSEEEKKDSLSMLFESSDRLLNTITNYMDISLLTSGNMSVHKKDFIPGQVLRKIFDNYKTICSNRKLELLLEIPKQADNLPVNSDPEIFQKIISHLLNNAVKFTEKGSIHYGYLIREGELEFFVKDTGIGIGKESFNTIFDHFVKEDRGPSVLSEGSGLGLSIARGMIDITGGKIRVESERGLGSCFYFTIPLIKNTEITLSGTLGRKHEKIKVGASILVAEDDETNFYYLNALLIHETGATVLHASNGREAIELFKANPGIILILMDIKMPEIDGFEATKQIKLIKKEVPVIAITAYAMSGDEERVLAAGCDGYLSKPISKNILLEKMAEFIEI